MTAKRFSVEELDLVSDHLSTRFFIVDNENMSSYDVHHIVSDGFEVQFDSWAEKIADKLNELHEENEKLKHRLAISQKAKYVTALEKENERLKLQLYCDDEEGVCNICKHHYLIKDDEAELGYYNLRCKKGHCECARVSLKHCEDFEKELEE